MLRSINLLSIGTCKNANGISLAEAAKARQEGSDDQNYNEPLFTESIKNKVLFEKYNLPFKKLNNESYYNHKIWRS